MDFRNEITFKVTAIVSRPKTRFYFLGAIVKLCKMAILVENYRQRLSSGLYARANTQKIVTGTQRAFRVNTCSINEGFLVYSGYWGFFLKTYFENFAKRFRYRLAH